MNIYEQAQESRRQHLLAAADRHDTKANAAYAKADLREESSGIPLGQPVLVGHHSEGRHRRALERADNAMRKSIEHGKTAEELRHKAAGVGSAGISSDDPDAIEKLRTKIAELEHVKSVMKAANKVIRSWVKKGVAHDSDGADFDSFASELAVISDRFTPAWARKVLTPLNCGGGPFQPFQMTSATTKIKAAKDRIEQLQARAARVDKNHSFDLPCGPVEVVENAEDNRLQFIFDGKPASEVRAIMKANGFRWSPTAGAWQRQLTNNGIYAGRRVITALRELGDGL